VSERPHNIKKQTRVGSGFEKIAPIYNRVAKITHNKAKNIFDYGENNLLPNQLLKAVEASVTASSCRNRKHEFIEGKGIKDYSIASLKLNPKQTSDDLIAELADIVGLFDGVALNVKYNSIGEPYYVYSLPFENTRKTDDGQFYVNDTLQLGKDLKKDRVYYDEFDRYESTSSRLRRMSEQIEEYGYQTGDIIYLFSKKAGQSEYPIPGAWAGMEEIEADSALGKLDWRNVKKGFRPDAILTTIGEIDDEEEDETGHTEQWYFDQNVKNFTGEDAAPIMHINVNSADQRPQLDVFSQEKLLNSTTEAADRIGKRVCRAMDVPHVLIPGFAQQGQLGNTQEMLTSLKLFGNSVGRKQRIVSRALEQVFPQFDWAIEPLVIIEELPDWLLNVLTVDEKRQLGGFEVIADDTTTKSTGVIDALGAISPLVATKVLSEMSGIEIRSLVGLGELVEGETASGTSTEPTQTAA
jgi:hypothetical protein